MSGPAVGEHPAEISEGRADAAQPLRGLAVSDCTPQDASRALVAGQQPRRPRRRTQKSCGSLDAVSTDQTGDCRPQRRAEAVASRCAPERREKPRARHARTLAALEQARKSALSAGENSLRRRGELHANKRRRHAAQHTHHLLAVVDQVVKSLLDVRQRRVHSAAQLLHAPARQRSQALCKLRQLRHILSDAVQKVDHGEIELFFRREERIADLDFQRRLGAFQHGLDGLRGLRFDVKLPLHASRVQAWVAHHFQRLSVHIEIVDDLCAALNGPLAEQGGQRRYLALLRQIVDGLENSVQRSHAVLLHGLGDPLRAHAQLLELLFLGFRRTCALAQIHDHALDAGADAISRYARCQHGIRQRRRCGRAHAAHLSEACRRIDRLRDFRRRGSAVCAQIVDLVKEHHDLLVGHFQRLLPLGGPVSRLIGADVHSRAGHGDVPQETGNIAGAVDLDQILHSLAGLSRRSGEARQILLRIGDLCA